MKLADLVAYGYVAGKERILDFSPTDRWIGKNPCAWVPFKVPHYNESPRFLGQILEEARQKLGRVSVDSAEATSKVADWRAAIDSYTTLEEFNAALPKVEPLPTTIKAQIGVLLRDKGKTLGITYDKTAKAYVQKPAEAFALVGQTA